MASAAAIASAHAQTSQFTLPSGSLQPQQQQQQQTPAFPASAPIQTPTITNQPRSLYRAPSRRRRGRSIQACGTASPQQPRRRALAERNEFQRFIEESTGQRLPVFGHQLFEQAPSTFAPVENIPVPADYVIGPGDELLVRAWGQIDVDYRAVVDRNGTINIPRVGSINVAGIKYADLTSYVRNAVARNFRNFDLLVTLGQLRTVQIFVVGYAPPRQLYGELAQHAGERHLLRRRPIRCGLNARCSQARQPRRHRTRPLRPPPHRRQVERRGSSPG